MTTDAPTGEELDRIAVALGRRAGRDVPLGPRTTYRVGGRAAVLVEAEGLEDVEAVGAAVGESTVDVLVLGRGSNLLVADGGFPGVVLALGDGMADIAVDGTIVRAGAGASLPVVARQTARAGLTGFEWAVGVPGSIGGAVRMNAGGHGSDMAASLRSVDVVDLRGGGRRRVPADDLALGYRSSSVGPATVVVTAELALERGDRPTAEAEIGEIVRWRRENQPGGQNAGSVFVNPEGDSAGRLVDVAGCKGMRHGTAEVSPKHANFIQADPGGSADDVHALMSLVRDRVTEATGITLRPETRLVGFDAVEAPT